jgi:CheY-like chemotaxis protein
LKILLVEDNIINQKVANQFLIKWGLQVTIANHGKEAVELILHNKHYNLVLMDLNMPEMDGYEATAYIRSLNDPYFKNIPILAFTASSLADSKEKAQQLGMTDFLAKPLNPQEMYSKINQYMMDENLRPLTIKFDAYNDGEVIFKLNILDLMISNIRDLQQALSNALFKKDIKAYKKAAHKVRSTLIILDDREFSQLIDTLTDLFEREDNLQSSHHVINKFTQLSESIIRSLDKETRNLKTAS